MIRALIPATPAERAALRRECEADLAVWIAANGSAIRIPFPQKKDDADEAP